MLTRPVACLEVASPVALVAGRRRSHHVRSAFAGSIAVIASLSICVGVGYLGIVAAVLAACALVYLCFSATRSRWVQRCVDRQIVARARRRRESSRLSQLRRSGAARQQQYGELRELVEGIERSDPLEAQRFELQDLLDYYAQLSAGHQRCLESLRLSGSDNSSTTTISDKPRATDRHGIGARRTRHRQECTVRLEAIADEIDSTDELIRLIAQRVACASLDPLIDREIERRLAELDEIDAAFRQMAASA